ncbi:YtxH domain-containing protein [Candidatus Roizmanbacteria bacterium]|nr:YtxH domain-containing protein [Candidatus Roizmanbacteria bacterium]
MPDSKKSKLGLGLVLGTLLGGLAAFFLSPKSGSENRKEAKAVYLKAKGWLKEELVQVKKEVGKIDKTKYLKAVENVMSKVKKEVKKDTKELEKLKKQLMKGWTKLQS